MTRKRNRVTFVIPYFGAFPWYFKFFFHTCSYNPGFDFILITDHEPQEKNLSKNIIIIKKTFEEVVSTIKKKLKLDIGIDRPYKLCDFRPAFGIIFDDILKGYDFWGHTDPDVILGRLKGFITNKMIDKYDVITMRHDYLVGCMTLYKNAEKVNLLFTQGKDYKKIFAEPGYYGFDETNFHFQEFAEGTHYSQINSEMESMTHVVKKMSEQGYIQSYFMYHMIEDLPGKMKWVKGKLIFNNQFEAALYHMIQLKKIYAPRKPIERIPDSFHISPTRLYF